MKFSRFSGFLAFLLVSGAATAQATDLSIFKQAQDQFGVDIVEIAPLSQIVYVLTVSDSEEGVVGTGIVVTDNVPSLISIDSVETDFGSCTTNGQQVSCDLNGLADGGSAVITITGTLSGIAAIDSEITNTANVTASNEIQPANNEDFITILVGSETIEDPDSGPGGGCALSIPLQRTFFWNFLRRVLPR